MERALHAAVLAGLLAASAPAAAEREIDALHCLHGCPMGASSNNNLIIRAAYILSSNDITKFADWVAYRITPGTGKKNAKRGKFAADPALAPEETLEPKSPDDYKDAHMPPLEFDRGHQAPFAGLAGAPEPHTLNYLSNITPQKSALNRSAWKKLEHAVRKLAEDAGEVFVMTGPLYQIPMPQLPNADEAHLVPSGYWKIITVKSGNVRWAAFKFGQNTPAGADYCAPEYRADIRSIARLSKLEFFHGASYEERNRIENSNSKLRAKLGCS